MASKYNIVVKAVLNKADLYKQVKEIETGLKPLNLKINVLGSTKADDLAAIDNQLTRWQNKLLSLRATNSKIWKTDEIQKMNRELQLLMKSYDGTKASRDKINTDLNSITTAFGNQQKALKNSKKDWKDVFSSITGQIGLAIDKMLLWKIAGDLVFGTMKQIQQAQQLIIDLNKETTNIRIVTGMSAESVNKLSKEYNELGKEYGATTIEVSQAATEWLRAGKSQADTTELVKSSLMLAKLANMDTATATEKLGAVMNGFNLEAQQSIGVLDRLVALDNAFFTSTEEIISAMQRSSSVAQSSGVDFEHLAAYITAVSSKTRTSAESIGEAMKTMLTRMQTIKMGKFFEDETQSLSDVEKALAQPGIEIALRKSNREFRDMQDVLDDIGTRWETFDPIQQSVIAGAIAGTRQAEKFRTIMNNFPEIQRALNIEIESGGLALSRYDIYLQSVEASSNRLKAAWEKVVMGILDSNILNFFNNFMGAILDTVADLSYMDKVMVGLSTNPLFLVIDYIYSKITGTPMAIQKLITGVQTYLGAVSKEKGIEKVSTPLTSGKKSTSTSEEDGSFLTSGGAASATKELSDNQKAYNDLLKMAVDMLKDKANAEKDALKDELDGYKQIIDAQKEILDQQEQERKYKDEMADKNKELSDIENELLEIQFDNSEWANKRRKELTEERVKKQKDIEDKQADHSVDMQKDALDKEYDDYKKYIDAKIKEIDNYLKETGTITQEAIALLADKSSGFYQELIDWNRKFGTGVDADVTDKWNKAFDSVITYSGAAGGALTAVDNKVASSGTAVDGLTNKWDNLVDRINAAKKATSDPYFGGGAPFDRNKDPYGGGAPFDRGGTPYTGKDLYADDNPYLYDSWFYGGFDSGGIVGIPKLQSGQKFAQVMEGEAMTTPNQIERFINSTLPNLISAGSGGDSNVNLVFNVAGSIDKDIMPQFEKKVLDTINKAMKKRGFRSGVTSYSV